MDLPKALDAAPEAARRRALQQLLATALAPAFGSATKRELELAVVEALVTVGFLPAEPTLYDLIQRLRITRARARGLLYERELRRRTPDDLDALAREALRRPLLLPGRPGQLVLALEIENPLLNDHLRHELARLGFATDGSFSPSLIQLPAAAGAALIERYLPVPDRERVRKALVRAGAKDTSLRAILTGVLTEAARRVAGKAGESLAAEAGEWIGEIAQARVSAITKAAWEAITGGAEGTPYRGSDLG